MQPSQTAPAPPTPLSWATALSVSKAASDIALGRGIPSLPKRLVKQMLAWQFIDLAELPPVRAHVLKDLLYTTPNVLLI